MVLVHYISVFYTIEKAFVEFTMTFSVVYRKNNWGCFMKRIFLIIALCTLLTGCAEIMEEVDVMAHGVDIPNAYTLGTALYVESSDAISISANIDCLVDLTDDSKKAQVIINGNDSIYELSEGYYLLEAGKISEISITDMIELTSVFDKDLTIIGVGEIDSRPTVKILSNNTQDYYWISIMQSNKIPSVAIIDMDFMIGNIYFLDKGIVMLNLDDTKF